MSKLNEEQGRQITQAAQYFGNLFKNIDAMFCSCKRLDILSKSMFISEENGWRKHGAIELKAPLTSWYINQYRDESEKEIITIGVLLFDPRGCDEVTEPLCIVSKCLTKNTDNADIFWIGLVQGFCGNMRGNRIYHIDSSNSYFGDGSSENSIMSKQAFENTLGKHGKVISAARPLREITEFKIVETLIKQVIDQSYEEKISAKS